MAGEEERNGKKMKVHEHRRITNTRDFRMKNDNDQNNFSITSNISITSSVHNCHVVDRPLLSPSTKVIVIIIIVVSFLDDLAALPFPIGSDSRQRISKCAKERSVASPSKAQLVSVGIVAQNFGVRHDKSIRDCRAHRCSFLHSHHSTSSLRSVTSIQDSIGTWKT